MLLAFYDFPAEHWKHLRTTNPIESTSPTRQRRTVPFERPLNKTAFAMVFKLVEGAQKARMARWPQPEFPKLIQGVKITDGIEAVRQDARTSTSLTPLVTKIRP